MVLPSAFLLPVLRSLPLVSPVLVFARALCVPGAGLALSVSRVLFLARRFCPQVSFFLQWRRLEVALFGGVLVSRVLLTRGIRAVLLLVVVSHGAFSFASYHIRLSYISHQDVAYAVSAPGFGARVGCWILLLLLS